MFLEKYRVPIPEGSRVKDGKVQLKVYTRGGWSTVGKLPSEGSLYDEDGRQLMIPNSLYHLHLQLYYRDDVVIKDPDNIPAFFRDKPRIGMFALFLGAVTKSGLYDILIDVFGVETANALLDMAMYHNWKEHLSLTGIDLQMEDEIMFSVRPHTEEWYENLVGPEDGGTAITEEKIQEFLQHWTQLRQKTAPAQDTVVHVSCTAADWIELPHGSWADQNWGVLTVCETGGEYPGLPLAYHIYPGQNPAPSNFQDASALFQRLGLAPKRLIAGRDFCRSGVLYKLEESRLPWLVRMFPFNEGHDAMLQRHEEELLQGKGTPVRAREPLLAVCEEDVPIFGAGDPDRKAFTALYCITGEAKEYRERYTRELARVYQDACTELDKLQPAGKKSELPIPKLKNGTDSKRAQKAIADAEEKAAHILFNAVSQVDGRWNTPRRQIWDAVKVEYHPEEKRYTCAIDKDMERYARCYGFYIGLASSEPMSPQEMSDEFPIAYLLGDHIISTTFSAMHCRLNTGTPGGRSFPAWFFVSFLSDILRALLMPSFREFEAARYGEIKAESMRHRRPGDLEEENPKVFISIGKMLSWLYDVNFTRDNTEWFRYTGCTEGVRGAVLEAAGIPLGSLPYFASLLDSAEDPNEVRKLRQMRRTIPMPPAPRKRSKQAKSSASEEETNPTGQA